MKEFEELLEVLKEQHEKLKNPKPIKSVIPLNRYEQGFQDGKTESLKFTIAVMEEIIKRKGSENE